MSFKQSDSFKQNCFFWTVFGLWPGKIPNKYYKIFSFTYLIISLVAYNALLTLNLYYTPRKIDLLIREVIFYFTEIAVSTKVSMILFKRKKLFAIFDLLDSNEFQGNDDIGKKMVVTYNSHYKKYLVIYTAFSNFTYLAQVLFPVIGLLFFTKSLSLPICEYYFLSEETKREYFTYIFLYQSIFMYGHMMYNVNIDSLIVGLMVLAIAQVKVLCYDMQNLQIEKGATGHANELDQRQMKKLHECVKHHELILKYCRQLQDIISGTMFVQFGIGSAIICVVMCGLLLVCLVNGTTSVILQYCPSTVETSIFMVGYFFAMSSEIFVPAWLGTQLSYESTELMVAAYKSEWISQSQGYKRSLRMFVERAKYPVQITGLKIFPLSLATYISIMKTAYSCFTLVRFFLDRQEH